MAQSLNPISRAHRAIEVLFTSPVARRSALVFAGSASASALTFVGVVLVGRILGPQALGIFGLYNAVLVIAVALTDLGLAATTVRVIADLRQRAPDRVPAATRVIALFEMALGGALMVAGLLGYRLLAAELDADPAWIVLAALVSAGIIAGGGFGYQFLLAEEKLTAAAAAAFAPAGLRLVAFGALIAFDAFTITTALLATLFAFAAGALIQILLAPRHYLRPSSRSERARERRRITRFTKWLVLMIFVTSAATRVDLLFIAHFMDTLAVGHYAAAVQVISLLPLLSTASNYVLVSRAARAADIFEVESLVRRSLKYVSVIALMILPLGLLAGELIPRLFGTEFDAAVAPFRLLLIGGLCSLVAVPALAGFYSIDVSKVPALIAVVQLVVLVAMDLVLIPDHGLLGAATAAAASSGLAAMTSIGLCLRWLRVRAQAAAPTNQ